MRRQNSFIGSFLTLSSVAIWVLFSGVFSLITFRTVELFYWTSLYPRFPFRRYLLCLDICYLLWPTGFVFSILLDTPNIFGQLSILCMWFFFFRINMIVFSNFSYSSLLLLSWYFKSVLMYSVSRLEFFLRTSFVFSPSILSYFTIFTLSYFILLLNHFFFLWILKYIVKQQDKDNN